MHVRQVVHQGRPKSFAENVKFCVKILVYVVKMGGSQASKLIQNSKLMDTESIDNLSYLEDGQFAKIYKGHLVLNKQPVTIKVPRVIGDIRKEKKLVKTHIEEVKKLMPSIKRAKSEFIVRYLGVSYDDFRKEVWVSVKFV